MNKFTYAAFSMMMGLLFFLIVSLNFIVRFIAGIATIAFLLGTMIKMIFVVLFKEVTNYAGYHLRSGQRIEYAA